MKGEMQHDVPGKPYLGAAFKCMLPWSALEHLGATKVMYGEVRLMSLGVRSQSRSREV